LIIAGEMHLPKNERADVRIRTLESMKEHLQEFKTKGGGDLKKAKTCIL